MFHARPVWHAHGRAVLSNFKSTHWQDAGDSRNSRTVAPSRVPCVHHRIATFGGCLQHSAGVGPGFADSCVWDVAT